MVNISARTAWRVVVVACLSFGVHGSQAQGISEDVEPAIVVRISPERLRFYSGEDIRLHVEIKNESRKDVFVFKDISTVSNALAKIDLTLYRGNHAVGPNYAVDVDCFCSERATYPPLASELSRYWIALPPQYFYGGDVVMSASSFVKKLKAPGRYRIQGKYRSRGFLADSINNPLRHYVEELKQLPYGAWVGEVKRIRYGSKSQNSPFCHSDEERSDKEESAIS